MSSSFSPLPASDLCPLLFMPIWTLLRITLSSVVPLALPCHRPIFRLRSVANARRPGGPGGCSGRLACSALPPLVLPALLSFLSASCKVAGLHLRVRARPHSSRTQKHRSRSTTPTSPLSLRRNIPQATPGTCSTLPCFSDRSVEPHNRPYADLDRDSNHAFLLSRVRRYSPGGWCTRRVLSGEGLFGGYVL